MTKIMKKYKKFKKNMKRSIFLFFDPKHFPGVPGAPGPIFRGPGPPKGGPREGLIIRGPPYFLTFLNF